jgi:hypothetical protein
MVIEYGLWMMALGIPLFLACSSTVLHIKIEIISRKNIQEINTYKYCEVNFCIPCYF